MCVTGRGPGLQPCVGSGCGCAATMCISEEEGFQQSVCEYLFVCGCACVEPRQCASAPRTGEGGGWGGGGGGGVCMKCGEGGMDINHQEEHGSVVPGGDGWGVSAVMSP